MRKTVLVYGLLGGVLIATLQVIQYRTLVLEHSLEIYQARGQAADAGGAAGEGGGADPLNG